MVVVAATTFLWWRFNAPPGATGSIFPFDLLNYYLPVTDLAASRLRAGELPLWNPYHCGGLPLLATLQVGVFYPFTWLTLVLPTGEAIALRVLLETLLAGLFTAWLLRSWGYRSVAAAAGGILFVFAFALGRSLWPSSLSALVWLPLLVLGVDRVVENSSWRTVMGLAIVAALQVLAGFPQFVLYTVYLLVPYALLRLVAKAREGAGWRACWPSIGRLAAAAGIAGLLAGAQVIPTLELVRQSTRQSELDSAQVHYLGNPLSSARLLRNALDPRPRVPFFSYLNRAGYIGTATLLLIILGLAGGARRARLWFFLCLGAAALLLSEGHHGPAARLFGWLPAAGMFRDPERLRLLSFFAALVLAAAGLDQVARGFAAARWRWGRWAALVGILLISVAMVRLGEPGAFERWLVAVAIAAVVAVWGRRRRQLATVCAFVLLAFLVADLAQATRPAGGSLRQLAVGWLQSYSREYVFLDDQQMDQLAESLDGQRLALAGLMPKMGRVPHDQIQFLSCLEPLAPARISRVHQLISGTEPRFPLTSLPIKQGRTLLDVFSVGLRVRVVPAEAIRGDRTGPGPKPRPHPRASLQTYTNEDALPRTYVATQFEVATREEALSRVARNQFDPWRVVLVDRPPEMRSRQRRHQPARIVEYSPEQVEIEAAAPVGGGLLVLTDSYFPGWRASVDGRRAEILTANGLFRAVELSPGTHRVRFEYRPQSVVLGLVSSSVGLLICIFIFWLGGRRRSVADAACAVCAHHPLEVALRKKKVDILACPKCGLGSWQPDDDFDPAAVYDGSYFSSAKAASGYDDYGKLAEAFRSTFRQRLARLPLPRPGADLLDVGAAYGYAVQEAAELGWRARGVDLSIAATAEASRRVGGKVVVSSAVQLSYASATFDVVTLWDVIEHLPDPQGAISEAARVLRLGGRLVLTTGDVGSLLARISGRRWHLYTLPEHLFFYSRKSLRVLLEEHGLQVESMRARASFYTLGYLVERLGKTLLGGFHLRGWPGADWRLPVNLFDIVTVTAIRLTEEGATQ